MNNEQKDAGLASDLNNELGITTEQPTETGLWLCSENNGEEWSPVIIHSKNGELMASTSIGGTYPLDAYHSNLINVKWKKAKIKHHPLT